MSVSPLGVIELNDSVYVRRTDIDTTNGVIHSSSGVLLPPSAKAVSGTVGHDLTRVIGELLEAHLEYQLAQARRLRKLESTDVAC